LGGSGRSQRDELLALIMLGRWTDANQLGAYATAVSVLALLLAAQESLITRPYTIQMDQLPERRRSTRSARLS